MKAISFCLTIFFALAATQFLYAQSPTYELQATNFERKSIDVPDDVIEFDIRMRQTNLPTTFEYAGGQYFFDFNKDVISGIMIMSNVGSDLPPGMQPRGPTVNTASTPGQLRWAVNTFPGSGNGYIFPSEDTSVLIVRVRLKCTGSMNPLIPLNLNWRNPPVPPNTNPVTKIFAYVNSFNTDITTPPTHSIDSSGFEPINEIRISLSALFEGKYYPLFNQMSSRDSVEVYLRDAAFPYALRDSAKGVIDSLNFSCPLKFINAPSGKYYIVVRHYQCIETWSREGGDSLTANGVWYSYNFTTSASKAYGNNLKLKGGKYCFISGDVYRDNYIDGSDMIIIDNDAYAFASGRNLPSDLNGDELTDAIDMLIADNNRSRETIRP